MQLLHGLHGEYNSFVERISHLVSSTKYSHQYSDQFIGSEFINIFSVHFV
jgi:hypothetical protein